ncbi:IPTL-CTERM sorting domain-containing protein [Diaphorobacter limosus]|uniref:IPTL-CTERM sorting domain-containing protein n=1 Tax=Diaphorobacter limosus TaxID=3036128 RepID=A0ABZ0J0Q6_9BURK|nr:IPTL-CTERM sorting domain-containing protein [Diaphorobacter sp. Y-1]WOO31815.1 IPTL-CTERM sorting domain-containing protein [Diaphorobacter sp. Y-1]
MGTGAIVVLTCLQLLPAGTVYYKYGKMAGNPTAHWYPFAGATISGSTITLTLTDGADGDDDLQQNSAITDPGGPVMPMGVPVGAASIPTLSEWALLLLSTLTGLFALAWLRGRKVAGA